MTNQDIINILQKVFYKKEEEYLGNPLPINVLFRESQVDNDQLLPLTEDIYCSEQAVHEFVDQVIEGLANLPLENLNFIVYNHQKKKLIELFENKKFKDFLDNELEKDPMNFSNKVEFEIKNSPNLEKFSFYKNHQDILKDIKKCKDGMINENFLKNFLKLYRIKEKCINYFENIVREKVIKKEKGNS